MTSLFQLRFIVGVACILIWSGVLGQQQHDKYHVHSVTEDDVEKSGRHSVRVAKFHNTKSDILHSTERSNTMTRSSKTVNTRFETDDSVVSNIRNLQVNSNGKGAPTIPPVLASTRPTTAPSLAPTIPAEGLCCSRAINNTCGLEDCQQTWRRQKQCKRLGFSHFCVRWYFCGFMWLSVCCEEGFCLAS